MNIIVNRHVTFIDSLQFYNISLDTLASNLNNEDFKYLVSEFRINKLEILKRKYPYPYEWVDLYENSKDSSLPEKKYFYSSTNDGKRNKGNGQFLMSNVNIYKMLGKYLILILSKIFIIIICKKMYYY